MIVIGSSLEGLGTPRPSDQQEEVLQILVVVICGGLIFSCTQGVKEYESIRAVFNWLIAACHLLLTLDISLPLSTEKVETLCTEQGEFRIRGSHPYVCRPYAIPIFIPGLHLTFHRFNQREEKQP